MSVDVAKSEKKSSTKKYLLIGCLSVFVLLIIGGIAAYYGIKRAFTGLVDNYTDTQPRELMQIAMAETDVQSVIERADKFKAAVKEGKATDPLVLSGDDINALIQHHSDLKDVAGKAYVTIEDDRIRGEISVPLEKITSMMEGRYLNGSAEFTINLVDGRLLVFLESLEVRGKPVPEEFMKKIRSENLAKEAQSDPEIVSIINGLKSIDVADGYLTIIPK
jgi:hypothetical protein